MSIQPNHANVLRRLITGDSLDAELQTLAEPWKSMAGCLMQVVVDETVQRQDRSEALARARAPLWDAMLSARTDRDSLILALANAPGTGQGSDLAGSPAPRAAHLGDLSTANLSGRFIWPQWIVRGHFTLLTSEPKVGKTRLGLEIAKRLWHGSPWPDGQAPTFPPGTKTLWIPGDRQQDELRELAPAYGLPLEAVLLNASPAEPYGGVSLDEPENVEALRQHVVNERPGLIFIDTVWRATRRKLSKEDEVNLVMDPLIEIAQQAEIAIIGMMHASKDGETLGRRLEGLARAVIKLSKPDPENQPARRKFWVDRANFLEPPPLGVTVHDGGCDFDSSPPADAIPSRGGRPPEKLKQAKEFLIERLSSGDMKQVDLINEWIDRNESKGTIFNAMRDLHDEGTIIVDDTRKPRVCHLVRNDTDGRELLSEAS